MPDAIAQLATEKYVLLTTFRKTGVGVPTAVWVAPDGDALVVTTMGSAGKVKRIRNNPQVTLQPCSMRGAVKGDAPAVTARAEIVEDAAGLDAGAAAIVAKYGWQAKLAFRAEERRAKGHAGASGRVILRITGA